MNLKQLAILATGMLLISACNKTYVCNEDATGITTGEVKARSKDKAASLCGTGHTANPK